MWLKIFKICFNTIKDNDIIWMQYRILYRILGTKDYLFKLKLASDGICNLCKNGSQTILHLITSCEIVKNFWAEVKDYIKSKVAMDLSIDKFDLIFGSLSRSSCIPINTTYLVAKLYLFRTSRSNLQPSVKHFFAYFNTKYLEQEYIAKLESKHNQFVKI